MKILANDGIDETGKNLLQAAGHTVDTNPIPQEELATKLQFYDGIIVRSATKVRQPLIDACPNLKFIARGGVGMDNIDVTYAQNKGIAVINTPSASSTSVAELVFAHLFGLSRFLQLSNREMPTQGASNFNKLKKNYSAGFELKGKTIGIIGCGRIGQEVARIAFGVGMQVMATDVMFSDQNFKNMILNQFPAVQVDSFENVLANADILTIHVPGGKDASLINKKEFDTMKDGVVIINCARGGVINESDLLNALNNGKVQSVGLDVFENEPTPLQTLLNHPKVSVTPHIGASTIEAQERVGIELAERILSL